MDERQLMKLSFLVGVVVVVSFVTGLYVGGVRGVTLFVQKECANINNSYLICNIGERKNG